MRIISIIVSAFVCASFSVCQSQTFGDIYKSFRENAQNNYASFRDECNKKYSDFLRTSWAWFQGNSPLPLPDDKSPVPPRPYYPIEQTPIIVEPTPLDPIELSPQPKPIAPIKENPTPIDYCSVDFYGLKCNVRFPEIAKQKLLDCSPIALGNTWDSLSTDKTNNLIRDCLEFRIRYNLCDWAYLQFLLKLTEQLCTEPNYAVFLTAFLYCQSGYQMRIGEDKGNIVMLISSKHYIYGWPYYIIDGETFYPLNKVSDKLKICDAKFENETQMSLYINNSQILGQSLSENRIIKSKRYSDTHANSQVPKDLIDFFNSYPTSAVGGNAMTRWAMYANTPLAEKTKAVLYPDLEKSIMNRSKFEAANKLLNWVQTGFEYEYDDKVWGHDRAFFAEETLYYPYCDCEDRSILFSRLIRDLLGLDVALIYYPGHLATAVKFDSDVEGDAMLINGEKYIVCDPTYIGAPVGAQMPNLEYDKAEAIVLKR